MWKKTGQGARARGGRRTLGWFSAAIAVAAPVALVLAGPVSADGQADPVAAVGTTPTSVATPTSSAPTSAVGQSVTFTTTVTSSTALDGGAVTFSAADDAVLCASVPVAANGTASCTDSALTAGSYDVVAAYSGDATFAPSSSAPVQQIVIPAPTAPAPTTGTPSSSGSITQNQTITTGGSTTVVTAPAKTVTVTPHKVAKKTAKPLTLNYLRIVPPHVHWCETCSYPNATIEFSLSKRAEVRMLLFAPVNGKERLVHTDTLNGHTGANRFRLAGRWRGQLVPKRGVHITFQLLVNGTWVTKKTIPVTVKSRYTHVVPS